MIVLPGLARYFSDQPCGGVATVPTSAPLLGRTPRPPTSSELPISGRLRYTPTIVPHTPTAADPHIPFAGAGTVFVLLTLVLLLPSQRALASLSIEPLGVIDCGHARQTAELHPAPAYPALHRATRFSISAFHPTSPTTAAAAPSAPCSPSPRRTVARICPSTMAMGGDAAAGILCGRMDATKSHGAAAPDGSSVTHFNSCQHDLLEIHSLFRD